MEREKKKEIEKEREGEERVHSTHARATVCQIHAIQVNDERAQSAMPDLPSA